jgi:putative flippase GtrA
VTTDSAAAPGPGRPAGDRNDGPVASEPQQARATPWPERAGDLLTSWVDRLPPRLRRLLPRELVGFAIIGAVTLSADLALLTALRDRTRLPLAAAVSIGYLSAAGLNFVLNRTANFRSHAPVGRQAVRYGLVMAGDYLLTVGVSTGLAGLGLSFAPARLAASFVVAVFTYSASRWWVFRDRRAPEVPVAGPARVG